MRAIQSQVSELLQSHIGQSSEADIGHLADSIKRHCLSESLLLGVPSVTLPLSTTHIAERCPRAEVLEPARPTVRTSEWANQTIRGTVLTLYQPVLSRKHASLSFMQALGTAPTTSTHSSAPLPALTLPPQPRPQSRHRSASSTPAQPSPLFGHQSKGKTRADILREYRAKIGTFYASNASEPAVSPSPQIVPIFRRPCYCEIPCFFFKEYLANMFSSLPSLTLTQTSWSSKKIRSVTVLRSCLCDTD